MTSLEIQVTVDGRGDLDASSVESWQFVFRSLRQTELYTHT